LYAGDMINLKNAQTGNKFKLTNITNGWRCHAPGKNEMPGLEEGINQVNIFIDEPDPNQPPMRRARIMPSLRTLRQTSG